jgi:hypothetical protein
LFSFVRNSFFYSYFPRQRLSISFNAKILGNVRGCSGLIADMTPPARLFAQDGDGGIKQAIASL